MKPPFLLRAAVAAVFAAGMTTLATAAPPTSVGSAPFGAPPATAPGKNKLKCFDGPSEGAPQGGACTIVGRGAMGPAVLDVSSTDPDGDYAGVYFAESSIFGSALDDIDQLGFHYIATDDAIAPGNLSLNLPIDENGDGVTEQYAFIDAYYCPGSDGVVDAIHDDECGIWYAGVQYENWDAFVDAYPDALVATDNFAFVIAERTAADNAASYRVNAVRIGKPGR